MERILITVEGGLIQDIQKPDELEIELDVLDFDTEGTPDEELCFCEMARSKEGHFHSAWFVADDAPAVESYQIASDTGKEG